MANGNLIISHSGKTIGIRFGFQALMAMSAQGVFNESVVKNEGEKAFLTAVTVTKMAWNGYLTWCLYMDEKPEMDYQQFFDFMDEAYIERPTLFSEILDCFNESKVIRKGNDSESEKKIPRKKK